jgi:nicotinamidase-related amidase
MNALIVIPHTTALVAIDLQHGIVNLKVTPNASTDVVSRTASIATALRARGGLSIFVRVTNAPDGKDALIPLLDTPPAASAVRPANWAELVPGLNVQPGDLVVVKRQWGAFYGTDLDLQLRRRGINTIILTGISTNIGVESTARDAFERGYNQVFVEDAMAAMTDDGHSSPLKAVFPRMGRVRTTDQVLTAICDAESQ